MWWDELNDLMQEYDKHGPPGPHGCYIKFYSDGSGSFYDKAGNLKFMFETIAHAVDKLGDEVERRRLQAGRMRPKGMAR